MAQVKQFFNGLSQIFGTPELWEKLYNFRLTPDGILLNDRGWESFKVYPDLTNHAYQPDDFEPIRFLGIWSRHQGAEVYYFYEQNGYLQYCWGNGDAQAGLDRFVIDGPRNIPSSSRVGTQMIECGDFVVFANGIDAPIKFWGHERISSFSGLRPTGLFVYDIYPTFRDSGEFEGEPSTAFGFEGDGGAYGITPDEVGSYNFGYKYSFIYDSGSEGPLSDEVVLDFSVDDGQELRYVSFGTFPERADNVVATQLYRTHQRIEGEDGSGEFYFVRRYDGDRNNQWSDLLPDNMLTTFAPGFGGHLENLIGEVQPFHYGTIWDHRLWLSGGSYNDRVIYSAQPATSPPQGLETFPVANFITFGTGGRITGLKELGDQFLIIFQEFAINLIQKLVDGSYQSLKLSDKFGTVATNSIVRVGAGVIFLCADGFYQIALDDHQFPILTKISNAINKTMKRLTVSALSRATACYNQTEREYWCHFPIDGQTENGLGAVQDASGNWTFRGGPEGSNTRIMAFTCLASDGIWTVIGTYPWDASLTDGADDGDIEDGTWHNLGLQVWTARDAWGDVLDDGYIPGPAGDTYLFSHQDQEKGVSSFETNWINFESLNRKAIQSAELICLGTTLEELELEYAINDNPATWQSTNGKALMMTEENRNRIDSTYGTGKWGNANGIEYRKFKLRYDLGVKDVYSIKVRGSTNNLLGIIGMSFIYDDKPGGSLTR